MVISIKQGDLEQLMSLCIITGMDLKESDPTMSKALSNVVLMKKMLHSVTGDEQVAQNIVGVALEDLLGKKA